MNEETKTQPTEEQIKENANWLEQELAKTKEASFDGERKPSLKLEENKITKVKVDFSKPFEKWVDAENNTTKKIIPVKVGEVELVWWLNVKNPVYMKLVEKGMKGETEFQILQTGNQKTTKYTIVEN